MAFGKRYLGIFGVPLCSALPYLRLMLLRLALLLALSVLPMTASESWWAFSPLREVDPPPLDQGANPIDAFVLATLREHDMVPAPPATRAALLRRLHFTVIGLPPSPAETEAFLADNSPDAYERRVDALLDDPRYGEHWASMWLDLVRYSESDGWNQDAYRPHIWRYRDYVVEALNADKDYASFVREQLAGDEVPGDDPAALTAAGFLRLGIYEYNQRDARSHWDDIMNEMTDTVGDVFLGVSMACARCHDHKFDDISQKDYFKLRAFFEPIIWRDDLKAASEAQKRAQTEAKAAWLEATKEVRAEIDSLIKPYHDRKWHSTVDKFPLEIQACFHKPVKERDSWEHQMAYLVSRQFEEEGGGPLKSMKKEDEARYQALQKQLAAFDHLKPTPLPPVMTVSRFLGKAAPTRIPDRDGTLVDAGYLEALPRLPLTNSGSSPREQLAAWISHPENPLTTRVMVNRLWQRLFGRGLVDTPSDFGRMGQLPSHPELLDWLARTFVRDGGHFKAFHRRVLTSQTWRQSSHHPQASIYQKRDPGEQWLWRAPVRRLPAEAIRDSMLAVSGELDPRLGGPSVDEDAPRRGLYVKRFRNDNDTFLHAFDMSLGLKSVPERSRTTTATQSLTMLNGDYVLARARAWARVLTQAPLDLSHLLYQAWGRKPTEAEVRQAQSLLGDSPDDAALTDLCHVLFNSNEFLYVH